MAVPIKDIAPEVTVNSWDSSDDLMDKIRSTNRLFRQACDQIIVMNNQINYLQTRYERAMKKNRRSFRYSLRLKLATLEGVRNMYYEYASRKADDLEQLQNELMDMQGLNVNEVQDIIMEGS